MAETSYHSENPVWQPGTDANLRKRKHDVMIDLTETSGPVYGTTKQEKRAKTEVASVVDLTRDGDFNQSSLKSPGRSVGGGVARKRSAATEVKAVSRASNATTKSVGTGKEEEKRLGRFRHVPPQKYLDYYGRAMTQRMFVLDRERKLGSRCPHGTADCPSEQVDLAGSTGNVYTIRIGHCPTCTCPDFSKGNKQCKHIIYVLSKVLKAPSHLAYQLAFLTTELREIFNHAGPLPTATVSDEDKDGNRRPVEGDCPICCEKMKVHGEEVVWCQAACGNNLHKQCFEQWATSRRGQKVTCPYCRTPWREGGDLKALSKKGNIGREGYINLASELGISQNRDYTTYHPHWVRRQIRGGRVDDHGEDWA